jgi:hypothetical protein
MHILANLCWASQFLDLVTREPSFQSLVQQQQELVLKLGTMLCTEMGIEKEAVVVMTVIQISSK